MRKFLPAIIFLFIILNIISNSFLQENVFAEKTSKTVFVKADENSAEIAEKNVKNNDKKSYENRSVSDESSISQEELENVLVDIKERIVIDDRGADFDYSIGEYHGEKYYELIWSNESYTQTVQYGEDKNIYFYSYSGLNNDYKHNVPKKLPQFSMVESEAIAKDFFAKAFPTEYQNFKLIEEPSVTNEFYRFTFGYYKDGISVRGAESYIEVDYINGRVTDFSTQFSPETVFESKSKIITPEQAREAFKKEIGLKKIFTFNTDEKNKKYTNLRIAYTTGFDYDYAINAKTAKRERLDTAFIPVERYMTYDAGSEEKSDKPAQILPMEQSEIDKKSELKTIEEVERAIKKFNIANINNVEPSYANLYERDYSESKYVWTLDYNIGEEGYSIIVDAKTLELVSFSDYAYHGENQKITKEHIEKAKSKSNEFLKKYAGKYIGKAVLDEESLSEEIGESSSIVRLDFKRKEKGVFFTEDFIYLEYSLENDRIVSFDKNWSDIRIPTPTKFVDESKIYEHIFEENKLELFYEVKLDENTKKPEAKLFYIVNNTENLPLKFTVTTGERIIAKKDDKKILSYEDIALSKYKSEAELLKQIEIGFKGGKLSPKTPVTQRELLEILYSAFYDDYYSEEYTSSEEKYRHLDLLLKGEEVSDLPITREDAIKYVVRAGGYRRIAEKSEIFKSELSDFEEVSKENRGYVAIAYSLGFLDSGKLEKFRPSEQATHDEVIKMVYNFLAFQ